ncbi:MAG TPA: cysteine desulfurase family protein [Chitinophaga sp.]|uniref:cysteine desulfurase family protein n=1 Tax=Chitinophaga sp. TaxID=1869181 RepID=UPI002D12B9BC|nr:cysteine desulfurase family protein [Chitinophaga sp.]HVI45896.1 cysteine desulfurase family protein [Chitinophaga sp.]
MHNNAITYLDNNATTKVDKRVLDAMLPFLIDNYANPHSTHYFGNEANKTVEQARKQVADLICADSNEIIFTSGATEAINIALKGAAALNARKGNHIITVATEHHAVLDTCKHLEREGFEVTYLDVDNTGIIDLAKLQALLRPETILVCIMYVNNETGVTQPIQDISSIVRKTQALFFSDVTQAVGKMDINVDVLDVDFLCISGHKIYGPKGIGALYVKNGIKVPTYTHGGGQEKGLRSGTLNVPGIIALGVACELCKTRMKEDVNRISLLRQKLEGGLLQIPGTSVNGNIDNRACNVTNICFKGHDANILIGRMKNIAVSNGSACASAIMRPSHVLIAMGLSDEDAFSSIRFSLGRFNTESEIEVVIKSISQLIKNDSRYA